MDNLSEIQNAVVDCRRCPRLVLWREEVALKKVRRYQAEEYWGRPVPGFGDFMAQLVVVGLAPAAHGGNRTGRMFTGDDSGHWLIRAMHGAGFSNQNHSERPNDNLKLKNAYVTAAVHCAPPNNKPTLTEADQCRPFLTQELNIIRPRVIVALGHFAFNAVIKYLKSYDTYPGGWQFGHDVSYHLAVPFPLSVVASYHPSRQNTQTGRLTESMLLSVFTHARSLLE